MDNLTKRVVRGICSSAQLREQNGCDAIYCKSAKGNNPPNSVVYFRVKEREVCVATTFFPTGHVRYDSEIEIGKMKECPSKVSKKSK